MSDACQMVADIGYQGLDNEKKASVAYSLSKNFIIDEMEDFEEYQNLTKGEFYELIGRLAHFLFPAEEYGDNYPLIRKIE